MSKYSFRNLRIVGNGDDGITFELGDDVRLLQLVEHTIHEIGDGKVELVGLLLVEQISGLDATSGASC